MKIKPDDPRLTAFVLGELDPEEASAIEQAVLESPKLQKAISDFRGLQENLVFELVVERELELTHKQRKEVLAAGRSSLVATTQTASGCPEATGDAKVSDDLDPLSEVANSDQFQTPRQGFPSRWTSRRTVVVSALVAACVAVSVSFLTQWLQRDRTKEPSSAGIATPGNFDDSDVPEFDERSTVSHLAKIEELEELKPDGGFIPPQKADVPRDQNGTVLVPEIPRVQDILDELDRRKQLGMDREPDMTDRTVPFRRFPRGERNPADFRGPDFDGFPEPPDGFEEHPRNLPGGAEFPEPRDLPYQWTREYSKSFIPPFVDSVSYTNVRRYLREGVLPPPQSVHVEEMVNYFDYGSPSFHDGIFGINLETAVCPWAPAHRLVRIALEAQAPESADGPAPRNYVFLIDTAAAMRTPARLGMLSESAALLAETLGPRDRITVLTYDGPKSSLAAGPLLGDRKTAVTQAFLSLHRARPISGTPIKVAYRAARNAFIKGGDNRVVILTDRHVEAGAGSGETLLELAKVGRQRGIGLTIGGIGGGVLKPILLTRLETEAGATCEYLDGAGDASRFFGVTLARPATPLASKLEIDVDFNRVAVRSYRLLGFANHPIESGSPQSGGLGIPGQVVNGYTLTALYEVIPVSAPVERIEMADGISLAERDADQMLAGEEPAELFELTLKYDVIGDAKLPTKRGFLAPNEVNSWTESSPEFRFSAAVAGYAMLLRESPYRGRVTSDLVQKLAEPGLANDPYGLRREFVDLVRKFSETLP